MIPDKNGDSSNNMMQGVGDSNFIKAMGRDFSASSGLRSVSFGDMKGHRKSDGTV